MSNATSSYEEEENNNGQQLELFEGLYWLSRQENFVDPRASGSFVESYAKND
jgi:hypothetical protein